MSGLASMYPASELERVVLRATMDISARATSGIDIGKNTFHLVGLDKRGAIVLQQKVSRGQLERRLANIPHCLIGMEACSGSHHIGRQLAAVGHDVRLIPAQYVKPFLKASKARSLGAKVMKDVTEVMGAGWLSIIVDPTGAALGLWQPKKT